MLTLELHVRLTLLFITLLLMLGSYTVMTELTANRWYFKFLIRLLWLSLWVAGMICFQAALWPGDSV